jgi:cytochrome P450
MEPNRTTRFHLCVRWSQITLTDSNIAGLPHLLIKDDVYKDYHIPAGSIVMTNVWYATLSASTLVIKAIHRLRLILRDPVVFPNPQEFQPARFLNDPRAVEVANSIFGFGRRCVVSATVDQSQTLT